MLKTTQGFALALGQVENHPYLVLSSSFWGKRKGALTESRLSFEVAAAQMSGPVNLVFSCQTGFCLCVSIYG